MKVVTSRGFCVCCGVQRDELGHMHHDDECIWKDATDIDYVENGERTKIFCPYVPKDVK